MEKNSTPPRRLRSAVQLPLPASAATHPPRTSRHPTGTSWISSHSVVATWKRPAARRTPTPTQLRRQRRKNAKWRSRLCLKAALRALDAASQTLHQQPRTRIRHADPNGPSQSSSTQRDGDSSNTTTPSSGSRACAAPAGGSRAHSHHIAEPSPREERFKRFSR